MTNSILAQIGHLLALTSNDEVNSLAALHFAEHFGRSRVYQLPMHQDPSGRNQLDMEQHGRCLFRRHTTFNYLEQRFNDGAILKKVKLTKEHDFNAFLATYGETTLPLFVTDNGDLRVFTTDNGITPRAGQTVIALVDPVDRALPETARLQEARAQNGSDSAA